MSGEVTSSREPMLAPPPPPPPPSSRPSLFQRHVAAVPLCVSVASSFLFYPVFKELIYRKACLAFYERAFAHCANSSLTRTDKQIQVTANDVLMFSSLCLTVPSIFTSIIVGDVSDRLSRKGAMLIPFAAQCLSDFSHLVMACYLDTSPYLLLIGEGLYGLGGGYMSLFGMLFTHAALTSRDKAERTQKMGLMEGAMGLGGTVGYFASGPLLSLLSFRGVFLLTLSLHAACAAFILLFVRELEPPPLPPPEGHCARLAQAAGVPFKRRPNQDRRILLAAFAAFGVSYMAFDGSQDVMYYYLKHQVAGWTTTYYGYLNGSIYLIGTVTTLLVFPLLSVWGVRDEWLALVGFSSRLLGRLLLVFVTAIPTAFLLVPCDVFSRWGAAAMKAVLSSKVADTEQGRLFAALALLQGVMDTGASLAFNGLYSLSVGSFPQLCFVVLSALMLIPIALVFVIRRANRDPPGPGNQLDQPADQPS